MAIKDILSAHYASVDIDDTISALLGKLRTLDEFSAVAFSKDKIVGMADKRKFLRTHMDARTMKVKKVVTKIPHLTYETSEIEAARLLDASDMHSLPVMSNNKIVGVAHARDVINALKPVFKTIRMGDLGPSNLFTLDEDEPISKAINRFREKGYDHVPVVDKKGNLIGIVAVSDLLEKYFAYPTSRRGSSGQYGAAARPVKEFSFAKLPIKNEMSVLVNTLSKNDPVSSAIDIMRKEHTSSVVLTEGTKPIGIVTIKDLLQAVGRLQPAARGRRAAKKR